MSTHSHTLASHGEILANLPGILGFYPNNSLILAFFVDDEGVDTVRLGPVARFDLDEAVEKLTESPSGSQRGSTTSNSTLLSRT